MLAIMGPTGSGKTSLLNVLANRCTTVKNSSLTGTLTANGTSYNTKAFARLSSYVMQDDAMFAALTVKETLMMAAHFQLPKTLSQQEKDEYVASIIDSLGLNKCQDTIIGDHKTRGVSGGERKRCNIGVELIKNPSVLFLDEPTSGLDSFQAQSVMACMQTMAASGRTVVASIHQPRSSIYSMFDQLLLLAEGRLMFFGSAATAIDHFAANGHVIPKNFNPADFFMDVVSPDYRSKELETTSLKRIADLGANWDKVSGSVQRTLSSDGFPEITDSGIQSSWLRQFYLCFYRSFITTSRDKAATYGKVIISIFFGLILGGLYSETGYNQKSIQDRVGILFFFTINQTFSNLFGVLNSFTSEKVVVERERASRSYHISAFYFGKFCAEIPFNFIGPLCFGTIVFWIVGLGNGDFGNFITFLCLLTAIGFCAIALGMIIASAAPTPDAANAIAPLFVVLMILFGGFYINIESLPDWLQWVQYLSLMRYAFEGLAVNEFTGAKFTCEDVVGDGVCVTDGIEVLDRLSFSMSVQNVFQCLVIFFAVEHVIAYLILSNNGKKYQAIQAKKKD